MMTAWFVMDLVGNHSVGFLVLQLILDLSSDELHYSSFTTKIDNVINVMTMHLCEDKPFKYQVVEKRLIERKFHPN